MEEDENGEVVLVRESLTIKEDKSSSSSSSSSQQLKQQQQRERKQPPPKKKQQRAAARAVAPGGEVTLDVVKEASYSSKGGVHWGTKGMTNRTYKHTQSDEYQAIKSCEGEAACVADALYRPRVAFIQKRVQVRVRL